MKKEQIKDILKGFAVFSASLCLAGVLMCVKTDAAGTYPAGAGTVAAIQSKGTLKYVINGTTVQFCSSDLVNLRSELISLGQWTDTKFSDLDTKMTALQNACK